MDHRNLKAEKPHSIMVGDTEMSLDSKTNMVTAESPAGTRWTKQGVDTVLLFGILAALTNRKPK